MSRDSLTTQDEQRDETAPAGSTTAETYGLPPHLVAQIARLAPGDSDALAQLMGDYRELANAILMAAASHVGNAAVRRAIDLVKQKDAYGSNHARAGAMQQPEQHAAMTDASDRTPVPPKDLPSIMEYPEERPAAAAVATPSAHAAETKKEASPAWIAGATAYNAAHPELVAEFNHLTDDMCCDDDTHHLDPQAVASWQGHHGLPADGKVGPHTVAAAKAAKTTAHAPAAPASAAAPA
jgi:murein L,D-transpeptidase YcbB/YkuD